MTAHLRPRVAVIHGVPLGPGGLAVQSANAVAAFGGAGVDLHVLGPAARGWPRSSPQPQATWHAAGVTGPVWRNWPIFRRRQGEAQLQHDGALGRWAAARVRELQPGLCYVFTHVALETLQASRALGYATVLDSPNGHIRNFRDVYVTEQRALCGGRWHGHPTDAMVARIEEEYRLADRIRVSSRWAKESLVAGGVSSGRIEVLEQAVDLDRYQPAAVAAGARSGPLRVVFVGTLDLRKGFVYLLRAARALAPAVSLELVGGTVDRCTRRILDEESRGLDVTVAPGDPLPALHRAELSVLPTLEDGSPFAAAEAMAAGRPLLVTDCCGASEWVDPGMTGWIVPPRDPDAISAVLREALSRRTELPAMGLAARAAAEARADRRVCDPRVAAWALAAVR